MNARTRWSWCGLVAAAVTLSACPGGGGRGDASGGDSAGAVKDTSQPQANLPASGAAADSTRAADSSRAAPGTTRDTAQPQPRLPSSGGRTAGSESKPGAAKSAASKPAASGSPAENDSARLRRLEQEARALAKVDGCGGTDQCRAAPVGHRPCGGPRTYIAYCARTTDSAALFRKLEQLAEAERAYNTKHQIGSTCEFRSPPPVEESSGSCHLRTAQAGAPRPRTP